MGSKLLGVPEDEIVLYSSALRESFSANEPQKEAQGGVLAGSPLVFPMRSGRNS